ncbi:MAG: alpha/beta fold hydrolase [Gammaproteobacteria bacterium]
MPESTADYSSLTWTSPDGLALYARDYAAASGPARLPVICIHGLTRNSADFDEVAPWLAAQSRRVIAVDVRGRGHSARDTNAANYNPATYCADIVKLTHDLGIERAVFVGTSMGGIITMRLALRHPRLIAAAVLNDIGPVLSRRGLDRIAAYAGNSLEPASWEQAAQHVASINRVAFPANDMGEWSKWARRAFAENAEGRLVMRYDPLIAEPLRTGPIQTTSWTARMAFRRLANSRPTLLVRGALSDLVEDEQASAMRRLAPRMQYVEVPGVGHAPMLTEPAARDALARFMEQVD